jgi:hypothetical protein
VRGLISQPRTLFDRVRAAVRRVRFNGSGE